MIHLTFERGAADFETICFYSKFLKVEKKKRDPEFSRLSRCLFISLSFLSLSLSLSRAILFFADLRAAHNFRKCRQRIMIFGGSQGTETKPNTWSGK